MVLLFGTIKVERSIENFKLKGGVKRTGAVKIRSQRPNSLLLRFFIVYPNTDFNSGGGTSDNAHHTELKSIYLTPCQYTTM